MNIEKIIKGYFMFVLVVLGIAVSKDAPLATQYLVSVLHNGESVSVEQTEENAATVTVPFEIVTDNDGFIAYIVPGEKDRDGIVLKLTALEENISLKNLRMKIDGVNPMIIKNAYLLKDGEVLAKGKKKDDRLQFSGFKLNIEAGESVDLTVQFALSTYAQAGERFRLIMEEADDLTIDAKNRKYDLPGGFKIKGPYLSVVGKRVVTN